MKVFIVRGTGESYGGEIDASLIEHAHWDDVSGGVRRRQNGRSLYGYIPYSIGKDIVKCSGQHDSGKNVMKVKICRAKKGDEYYEGYCMLVEQARKNQHEKTKLNIENKPCCTKRILEVLNDGSVNRGELRKKLNGEGYSTTTIRNALNTMIRDSGIFVEGSNNSSKQIIKRNNEWVKKKA